MCHMRQTIQKEWFRGSSRQCRLHCQKLNNQRMESDLGCCFIDPSPHDLMNESLKSEFDLSFASSNRSVASTNTSLHLHDSDANTSTSQLHQQQQHQPMSDIEMASESPPDSKRKYEMAVTPQKDREHKRQRPVAPHSSSSSGELPPDDEAEFAAISAFQPNNIRAQFRYQHLSNDTEDWQMDRRVPSSSSSDMSATASSHSMWSGFLDTEPMPE